MVDREWLLGLAKALHTTLDPEQLVRLFAEHAAALVPHGAIHFTQPDAGIDLTLGLPAQHSCSYDLVLDGAALGTLAVTRDTPFAPEETAILEDLLANLVHPLRNALMYRDAVRAAARDPLTGVNNRSGFLSGLEREVELARRHHTELSLVMIDADQFKSINDRFGHAAGDTVLRALAECLGRCVRDSDLLFRYGGEEFVVMLSNTDLDGAHLLAERIRAAVSELEVEHAGERIAVTISAGVATLLEAESAARLLHRADRAMYDAKAMGRNRVADAENVAADIRRDAD